MEVSKDEMRERLGNIDQIRDLLFGDYVRDHRARFEQIESSLINFQQEVSDRLTELHEKFTLELTETVDSLDKKLKYLGLSTHEEITDLRRKVDHLDQKITTNVAALDKNIANQAYSLRTQISQTRDSLQSDVESLKAQFNESLTRQLDNLKDNKISREDFAEVLFEICMRLKGTEIPTAYSKNNETYPKDLLLPEQKEISH